MKLKNSTSEVYRENDPIFTFEGKVGGKKVQMDYGVRPNQPAIVQARCKWIIGDVTEVLDHNTWKLGKIVKMLKNSYFVIRLSDCIQLKEFHISSLRVPFPHAPTTSPHSKQFPAADKATERANKQRLPADRNFPSSKFVLGMGHRACEDEGHSAKKHEMISLSPYTGATTLKSKLAPRGQAPSDALLTRPGKKRKSTAAHESHQPIQRRRTQPQNITAADHCSQLQHWYYPQAREESECCSVASCSVNDDEERFAGSDNRPRRASCFPGDAMSACPPCSSSGRGSRSALSDGSAIDVHELELEAYQSTVRALHASGPLTWEQESLLTNLRMSLNISNEEHLLQLRHLLSS